MRERVESKTLQQRKGKLKKKLFAYFASQLSLLIYVKVRHRDEEIGILVNEMMMRMVTMENLI